MRERGERERQRERRTDRQTDRDRQRQRELYIRAMGQKKRLLKKVFKSVKRTDRGRMTDSKRQPDETKSAATTGLPLQGWHAEHSDVCRRAELPGRSVKVKSFRLRKHQTAVFRGGLRQGTLPEGMMTSRPIS